MSIFHPLPRSMPFRAKADLMVKRGEARDFGHACSILRSRRKPAAQPNDGFKQVQARLPYKDE